MERTECSCYIGSHIKYLVHSVTKRNINQVWAELEKYLTGFGLEVQRFCFHTLMKDALVANLVEPSTQDSVRLQLLSLFLGKLHKENHFISVASEPFPSGTGRDLCEFLTLLCSTLRLSISIQLALGLALSHSTIDSIHAYGVQFLKSKLGEVTETVVKTLPESLLHYFMHFLYTADFVSSQERSMLMLDSLRTASLTLEPLSASIKEIQTSRRKRDGELSKLSTEISKSLSLAGVMQEWGPSLTHNKELLLGVLEQFPTITTQSLSEAIQYMALNVSDTASATREEIGYLNQALQSITTVDPPQVFGSSWNAQIFALAIEQKYSQIDWQAVIKGVDKKGFVSRTGISFLEVLYRSATGSALEEPGLQLIPIEQIANNLMYHLSHLSQTNLHSIVQDIQRVLTRDVIREFGPMLVRRASADKLQHALLVNLVEGLQSRELEKFTVHVSVLHAKELLGSERITHSTTDRTTLRNLGTFMGKLTLERNKPILMRQINFKELLMEGLQQGKLIAVVPFVAKVLETCKGNKIFKYPNPWLMGILSVLVEIHELPELKFTLRYEVESLCNQIGLDIQEVLDDINGNSHRSSKPKLMAIKDKLDTTSSADFVVPKPNSPETPTSPVTGSLQKPPTIPNPISGQQNSQTTPTQKLTDAPTPLSPYGHTLEEMGKLILGDGRTAAQAILSQGANTLPAIGMGASLPNDSEMTSEATMSINLSGGNMLVKDTRMLRPLIAQCIDQAVQECSSQVIERSVLISISTTKELCVKDYATDPKDDEFRQSCVFMAAHLAGNLAASTSKEPLRNILHQQIKQALTAKIQASPGGLALMASQNEQSIQNALNTATEQLTRDNIDVCVQIIRDNAVDTTVSNIESHVEELVEGRRSARSQGKLYISRTDPNSHNVIMQLPEYLYPHSGLLSQHRQVYYQFAQGIKPGRRQDAKLPDDKDSPITTLRRVITEIEIEARNHYKYIPPPNAVLSLTHPSFTSTTKSTHHERIKELVCCIHPLIREETTISFTREVISKVFAISQKMTDPNKTNGLSNSVEQYVLMLINEICLFILQITRDKNPQKVLSELTRMYLQNDKKWQHKYIAVNFIRLKLINLEEFDQHLAEEVSTGNLQVIEFAHNIVQRCLVDEPLVGQKDIRRTLEAMHQMSTNPEATVTSNPKPSPAPQPQIPNGSSADEEVLVSIDKVTSLFREWVMICGLKTNEGQNTVQQQAVQYISKLHQNGTLKGRNFEKFFGGIMELCVTHFIEEKKKYDEIPKEPGFQQSSVPFVAVDAFSDLVFLLARCEIAILQKILAVVAKVMQDDHDTDLNAIASGVQTNHLFHTQPYFRLFSNLLITLMSHTFEEKGCLTELLHLFAEMFLSFSPRRMPGFAFGWLELISHRFFLPKILQNKAPESWPLMQKLLVEALKFMEPYLQTAELTESVRIFYRGTLKILLVLLHDFPEFLCSYHFTFCDYVPPTCVQLRNIILSSFPRNMRLPDPFSPNLKVDLLSDIGKFPRIMSRYTDIMQVQMASDGQTPIHPAVSKDELDQYLQHRKPEKFLENLPKLLLNPQHTAQKTGQKYNVPLINAITLHCCITTIQQFLGAQPESQSLPSTGELFNTASMDIFMCLAERLDVEGRYYFLNSIANHLRYPNNHTHYCSCVILHLFEVSRLDIVQEQITRVLVERLMSHRPHPWGLLITFIELVKNRKFQFWEKSFIHSSSELERLFENVSQSCLNMKRQS